VILLTGAGGKTGRAVARALARRHATFRSLVRRLEQIETLRALGARETLAGDMRDREVWDAAVRGATSIYHICPNLSADEVAIGELALDAAVRARVRHFVYHSVLHPQTEEMPHHWRKLRVEEAIFRSGLPFTILQPAPYMQNVAAGLDVVAGEGVYRVPYAIDTRLGMVDLEDVAEVAAVVLTTTGHGGAIYELAGPEELTQSEVAKILAKVLGREVRAESIGLEEWKRDAFDGGLDNGQIQTLIEMFRYYERYGFWGNARVLEWLLGRQPATFAQWVEREIHAGGRN
jgi:NAD(P)H dehydrogenase (quinone)